MYTLRIFKSENEINRSHFNLGDHYQVIGADEDDQKAGVVLRIHGSSSKSPEDGFAIYANDNAFIMTESGKTFETLNKAKNVAETIDKKI